jgi:hypothetical protein
MLMLKPLAPAAVSWQHTQRAQATCLLPSCWPTTLAWSCCFDMHIALTCYRLLQRRTCGKQSAISESPLSAFSPQSINACKQTHKGCRKYCRRARHVHMPESAAESGHGASSKVAAVLCGVLAQAVCKQTQQLHWSNQDGIPCSWHCCVLHCWRVQAKLYSKQYLLTFTDLEHFLTATLAHHYAKRAFIL